MVSVFTYNDVYQLIEMVYPDSSSITFEYDANANPIVMTDTAGSATYLISGGYVYSVVMSAKLGIQQLRNLSNLLEYLPGFWKKVRGIVVSIQVFDDFLFSHAITFLNGKGEIICGSVTFTNGGRYVWKLVDGVHYVLINGEWVPITDPEWLPGKPLPSECD